VLVRTHDCLLLLAGGSPAVLSTQGCAVWYGKAKDRNMLEFFKNVSVADAHFASPAAQADWVLGAPFTASTRYKVEIRGTVRCVLGTAGSQKQRVCGSQIRVCCKVDGALDGLLQQ
jgi:hypothetical protein